MAFIRKRLTSNHRGRKHYSYQIVETYRVAGEVIQRVLINLGRYPTLDEAIRGEIEQLEFWRSWRWPPMNLVRQYGRKIPDAIQAEATAKRDAREAEQQDRIRELQKFQRSHPEF